MNFSSDMDYVIFYSTQLKNNASLFKQYKVFIESQIHASQQIFSSFKEKDFKSNARKYLKKRGIL